MNAKKHTPLSLHGLRLLFPPLATLGILFLTEWIARGSLTGETFTQYIFPPCRSLSAGMGHAVPQLAGSGLADPVCTVGDPTGGGAGLCPGGSQFLHTASCAASPSCPGT